MTAFNLRSIKSVANFNTVIVVLQVVLIAVILGMVIYGVFEGEGAGTLASSRPFWSGDACDPDDYRGDDPVLLVYRL
jgi:amino acid transporter